MDAESQGAAPRPWSANTHRLIPFDVTCPACQQSVRVIPGQIGTFVTCPRCGSDVDIALPDPSRMSASDPLVGTTLGGCRIIELLGQGGMAVVYKAEQTRLRRTVALKVMRSSLLAQDRTAPSRLLREARIAAQLEHPNIVQVYDAGEEAGHHYIVMQYIEGESVRDLIRRKGRLPPDEAVSILRQAVEGLDAAHARGTVHRDIKPSNLLADPSGAVKITDFGLGTSLLSESRLTRSGEVTGTAEYMSPEQCRGERPDARSDIYSLGVTVFEMLTGRPPFTGEGPLPVMYKHQHEPVPETLRQDPQVPGALSSVVERMMAKSADERYQSSRDVIADLGRLPSEGAPSPKPGPALEYRESFTVAQAALEVVRGRCSQFQDDDTVWEAFIDWRGRGEADYLRRIRAGGRYIFYAVLQDLYDFVEHVCGEDLTEAIGERLSATLLDRHMPDLLQTTLARSGVLEDQISWLFRQFVAGATGEVYRLETSPRDEARGLCLTLRYRSEGAMTDYLRRSGHRPARAFARSFNVFHGAMRALLVRTIHVFEPRQLKAELRPLRGQFTVSLTPQNRFHYENMIDILTTYVHQLRQRTAAQAAPAVDDAQVHRSPAMSEAWERVRKAAATDETVLLCGESGTGKSHYAGVMHDLSARKKGPFIEVGLTADVGSDNLIQSNLFGHVRGAFTGAEGEKQGLFTLAAAGTIFLDEIGDASPELQAKLLRVIDKKCFKMLGGVHDVSVDVRIIAATNKDLSEMVRQGTFREDLFYRLNVIAIVLPPLRSRPDDLPGLVQRLFDKVCRDAGARGTSLSDNAFRALRGYGWPGNIRELENALRHAVAFSEGGEIRLEHLPSAVHGAAVPTLSAQPAGGEWDVVDRARLSEVVSAGPPPPGTPTFEWPGHVDYARREYLRALIQRYGGSLNEIARHWDRSSENTILKLIRAFGLEGELHTARKDRP